MPEEHPDAEPSSTAGATTPADSPVAVVSGSAGSPRPGHFLPGGAGDILTEGDRVRAAERRRSLELGKARALTAPIDPTLRKKARPLPTDPGTEPTFGAPPPAPMPGAPVTPLAGTRRTRGYLRTGWHRPYARTGAQYTNEPQEIAPQRQYSKPLIAGLSAFAVLLVTGGTFAGFQLVDTYDNVDSPMARPTVKKSEAPLPIPADPTVTVTVQPFPTSSASARTSSTRSARSPRSTARNRPSSRTRSRRS
ncbi:hypothetical protein [Kribbella sp. CA-247076]|uniref:hypothetical protein n=1 Tax=Kribbella sp. CA-247076 TaxID=3239941 RepID=UPI003D8DD643